MRTSSFFRLTAPLLCLAPRAAEACTVCFGGTSAELTRGFYWGVLILMLLPFTLMAAFFGLIAYHLRKNRNAHRLHP
jgi:hypothetical protein